MFKERLLEERKRLGFTQAQMAVIGGVTTRSQQNYEATERVPDINYLQNLAKIGVDINYLIFGERNETVLSSDEKILLSAYRSANPQVKAFMLQGIQYSIQANGGQVVIGDNIKISGK